AVTTVTVANCNASHSGLAELGGGMSAVEFRKHAAEHLDWAKTAKSDRERQTFQQMAEAWLEAAVLWGMPGATKDRTGSSTERTLDTLRKPPASPAD
ncbi:MAG: hypothetical protein WBE50_11860, partial [Methyloceanibacter sp.]